MEIDHSGTAPSARVCEIGSAARTTAPGDKRVLCLEPSNLAGLSSRYRLGLVDPGREWTSADLARVLPP
jgi:hypothetical protein